MPDHIHFIIRVKEYLKDSIGLGRLIGNIFLLRSPDMEAVRFSSKITAAEWQARKVLYEETVDNGGILVSPFIHPQEKAVMNQAIEDGGSLILIQNRHYGERDKPVGKFFDLCAAGRLLIIAIGESETRKDNVHREVCLSMNELAEQIAHQQNSFIVR